MIAQSLSDAVYGYLFPSGMIPLAAKNNLAAIDQRIEELAVLATGKPLAAISSKERSRAITEKIVALKQSGLSIPDIARQMNMTKDACRCRWEDHKAKQKAAAMNAEGYAALSGQAIQHGTYTTPPEVQAKIENGNHLVGSNKLIEGPKIDGLDHIGDANEKLQSEDPTIRNCQIVQEKEEVPPQEAKPGRADPAPAIAPKSQAVVPATATDASREDVLRLYREGLAVKEIANRLGVQWRWVRAVVAKANVAAKPAEPARLESQRELTPMDAMILEMAGKNAFPSEICVAVNRNFAVNMTTGEMVRRIADLRRQRA